jgi:hypothetical protein
MKPVIHWCGYASQPDIQIWCDQSWTTPKWGPGDHVHRDEAGTYYDTDDGRLYTFEYPRATCLACAQKLTTMQIKEHFLMRDVRLFLKTFGRAPYHTIDDLARTVFFRKQHRAHDFADASEWPRIRR